MSIESQLDILVSVDTTDLLDHIYMTYIHLARLLDDLAGDNESSKFVLLSEMMNLDREINCLRHDLLEMQKNLETIISYMEPE